MLSKHLWNQKGSVMNSQSEFMLQYVMALRSKNTKPGFWSRWKVPSVFARTLMNHSGHNHTSCPHRLTSVRPLFLFS